MHTTVRNTRLRHGQAPGHVRKTFCNAVEAYINWRLGQSEPTVEYEVNYEPQQIPISRACTLVWNCTDIMPGDCYYSLRDDLDLKSSTYAAVARAMHVAIGLRLAK